MTTRRFLMGALLSAGLLATAGLVRAPQTLGVLDRWLDAEFVTMFPFLEPDPTLGWRNAPQVERSWPAQRLFSGPTNYIHDYAIGAEGERTSNFYGEHPIEQPRASVWILGDSSAFGLGSANDATFAEALKRALFADAIHIRNASVVGYDSSQVRRQFERRLETSSRRPDLLVLWVGFNDSRESWWSPLRSIPGTEQISNLRFRHNLRALLDRSVEEGIPVILNTLPSLEASHYLSGINREIRALSHAYPSVTLCDTEHAFRGRNRRDLYASIDEVLHIRFHPSRSGHALIAETLLPAIRARLDLDGPSP